MNFGEAARRSQALNSCLFSDAAKRAAGGPGVGRGRLVYAGYILAFSAVSQPEERLGLIWTHKPYKKH